MAGAQPATRRLLTEAAAALLYVAKAAVGTVGGPAGPLDNNGRLPNAQMPSNLSPPTATVLANDLTNGTTSPVAALTTPVLLPGTYLVSVALSFQGASTTSSAQIALTHASGAATGRLIGTMSANGAASTVSATMGNSSLGGRATGTTIASGVVTVTATGALILSLTSQTAATAYLYAGSMVAIQRLS